VSAGPFRFVQFDLAGRLGLDDGRYLLRALDKDSDETVLVVQTIGAPPAGGRVRGRRKGRRVSPEDGPPEVPLTRLTVIPAQPSPGEETHPDLAAITADQEAAEAAVSQALRAVNWVLRAHRIANQDPYGHEISRDAAVVVRVGYGSGESLADGKWEEAFDVPLPRRRLRRAEALRPQERLTELLAGREPIDVCETLLLRARADLDQDRPREAALQLASGVEALLTELAERAGPDQEDDLAKLRDRREITSGAAEAALHGELSTERIDELAETLRIAERVLRRRQALRQQT
jgi:hypothetical protein